ncbi:coat protein [ssRNA phage SRR6960799_26]|uniref:Coat protein n=1 Tax=ssRNA phage SRR6960799_26 TaxID=2786583 RepID=A0A8S5KZE3_9VIRU|nr:coat protein [ssRNA phage SRR6960799_26]DAD50672.1 TPA_asm: coat protein [ssRNA phage SRR6960799_26]
MPAMAALSVLKADNVTAQTYDVISGSPGDGGWAMWRRDTGANAAQPVGHRPTFRAQSLYNGPKTARRVKTVYVAPYSTLNTSTGRYETKDSIRIEVTATYPESIPAADLAEAAHQGLNCNAALLLRQSHAAGVVPT